MTKNAVIFVLTSLLVLLGSQYLMDRMNPRPAKPAATATAAGVAAAAVPTVPATAGAAAVPAAAAKPAAAIASASIQSVPEQTVAVKTGAYEVLLSSWGARFVNLKLKGVSVTVKEQAQTLDLVPGADSPQYGTLELLNTNLGGQSWTLLTKAPVDEAGQKVVRFSTRLKGTDLEFVKIFRFDPLLPHFSLAVQVVNHGQQAFNLAPLGLLWGPDIGGEDTGLGSTRFPMSVVVQLEGRIERERSTKDTQILSYDAPKWTAIKDHYFVLGLFPEAGFTKAEIRKAGLGKISMALVAEGLVVPAGKTVELQASAYAGPQEYDTLKSVGHNFQRVVQFQFYQLFDWLNPLSILLLHIMKWFHTVTGNWGVAIVLLTLLVRGVMFYPSMKSMVSMRRMQTKMAAMKPRLDQLKKIYKDDAQKMNTEMMALYKEYGVNPLGGCLPMLLQIPIFFSLYGTLLAAFELRGAHFVGPWTDLTAGDPTFIFPVVMGISMFLQQKLSPTNAATTSDEQAQMQKMMLWLMPIMFTGMAIYMKWPVGLLLYWSASNIFGIVQQLAVNKAID